MGIRGAASLLSTDRRRFGRPWVLSNATSIGGGGGDGPPATTAKDAESSTVVVVYIDGPALLYHIISHASDAVDDTSPTGSPRRLPPCRNLAASSLQPAFGVLPPSTVSILARSFVMALIDAGADEVHLVVEGLADESKEAEQVDRMSDRAELCDAAAGEVLSCGGGGGRQIWRKVPHPFAELAMIGGVESLIDDHDLSTSGGNGGACSSCDFGIAPGCPCCGRRGRGRVFVHRADGEAEAEICSLIAERQRGEDSGEEGEGRRDVVVLSNDTDFLAHECSPGFVPLDSVEFFAAPSSPSGEYEDHTVNSFQEDCDGPQPTTRSVGVRGWSYESSKFASSLDLPRDRVPVVAALAGCDRVPPTPKLQRRLVASRGNVLRDEKSGLRRRDRNNPSAKSCLVACARFVSRHGRPAAGHRGKASRRSSRQQGGDSIAVADDNHDQGGGGHEEDDDDDGGWLRRVAWAACGEGDVGKEERFDELLSALRCVSSSYRVVGDDGRGGCPGSGPRAETVASSTGSGGGRITMSVPLRRLLERRVLYCIPLVETYQAQPQCGGGGGRSKHRKGGRTAAKKKQKKKRGGGKRERERGSSSAKNDSATSPPRSPSAWMHPPFVEVRRRLYSLVGLSLAATTAKVEQGPAGRRFEAREYCRGGGGGGGKFAMREFDVAGYVARCDGGAPSSSLADRFAGAIAATSPSGGTEDDEAAAADDDDDDGATRADRVRLYWEALEYCLSWRKETTTAVTGDGGDENDDNYDERGIGSVLDRLPPSSSSHHLRRTFLAGLLLPPRAALLLSCCYCCVGDENAAAHLDAERCGGGDGAPAVGGSLLRSVALIQVACYHVDLLVEFLSVALPPPLGGDVGDGLGCDRGRGRGMFHALDDDRRAVACWAAIEGAAETAGSGRVMHNADGDDAVDADVEVVDLGTLRDSLRRDMVACDAPRGDGQRLDLDFSAGKLWTAWGYGAADPATK